MLNIELNNMEILIGKDKEMAENNKLIAEFMGCIIRDENGNLPTESGQHKLFVKEEWDKLNVCSPYSPNGVEYHISWNWLMPVIDKIDKVLDDNVLFKIEYNHAFIEDVENYNIIIDIMANSRLEATYKAIVEFIKWYNENK